MHWLLDFIKDFLLLTIAGLIVTFIGLSPIIQISILGSAGHSPWDSIFFMCIWYVVTIILGRIFSAIRNSFKQKNTPHRLKISPKILYLRSFKNDKLDHHADFFGALFDVIFIWQNFDPLRTLNNNFSGKLETKLAEICSPFGCLVCLSNNIGEFSTPPEGALRFVTEDSNWKAIFLRLLDESTYTIVLVDKSSSLEWELEQILASKKESEVLYVLPPKIDTEWQQGWNDLAKKKLVPSITAEQVTSSQLIGYRYLSHEKNEVEFICKSEFWKNPLINFIDTINSSNLKKDPYHAAREIAINSWRMPFIAVNIYLMNILLMKSIPTQIIGIPLSLCGLYFFAKSITSLYKALRQPYLYRVAYGHHLMAGSLLWIFAILLPIIFIMTSLIIRNT